MDILINKTVIVNKLGNADAGCRKAQQKQAWKLADMPVYSIPYPQIKKIAALKNHIWGL